VPGVYSQVGNLRGKTLDGLRPLGLNFSSSPSYHLATAVLTSRFMETTTELSKDGGKGKARTSRRISSSGTSTLPLGFRSVPYTQGMYPAKTTQLMSHLEEYTCQQHLFCPSYPSPQSCATSSQTLTLNSPLQALISTAHQAPCPSLIIYSPIMNMLQSTLSWIIGEKSFSSAPLTASQESHVWSAPLLPFPPAKHQWPAPYRKNLTPLPSPLWPHCPANQRLCLWRPLVPHPQHSPQLSDKDLRHIEAVMVHAWELDTHTTYASGLLNFMVFCDKKGIPEKDRAPVSQLLLMSFVSTLAAAYSSLAISNYVYGVQAWHILHGIPWKIQKMEMETLLKAAEKLTPPSSRRKKQCPYAIDFMQAIQQNMDFNSPLRASVFVCLATCFFATGHVREFTVQKLDSFNASIHVLRARIGYNQTREGQRGPSCTYLAPRCCCKGRMCAGQHRKDPWTLMPC